MFLLLNMVYRTTYLMGNPNLAEYIRTAIPVTNHPIIKTAATDGCEIYYNPDFFDQINDIHEIIGIFAHEYYHIVYSHTSRVNGRDPFLWNLCADVVVNEAVKNRGMHLPEGGIVRGTGIFSDLPNDIKTTTKIYDWLISQGKQMNDEERGYAQDHENEKQAASKLSQNDNFPPTQMKELEKQAAQMKELEKQAAQMKELEKQAGDSAELYEAMGLNHSDNDYIDLIKAVQIESGRLVHRTQKKSYERPARYEPEGLISKYSKHLQHHPKVDVYIDVSGSMGKSPLEIFDGLKGVLSKLRLYRPRFFIFNTEIKLIDIKANKFLIGGGTDIKKVIQKIKSDKADLAILLTDCEDNIEKDDFESNVVVVSDKKEFANYITKDWKIVKENKNAK